MIVPVWNIVITFAAQKLLFLKNYGSSFFVRRGLPVWDFLIGAILLIR